MPADWECFLITKKKKKVFEEKILDGKIIRPPGGALNVTFNPHKKNAEGRPEYSGKAVSPLRQRARVEDAGGGPQAAACSSGSWKRRGNGLPSSASWGECGPACNLISDWPPELKEHRCVVLNSNCVNVCVTSKFLLKYYSRGDSISQ